MKCERCGEPIAARDIASDLVPSPDVETHPVLGTAWTMEQRPYHRSIDICFVALAKAGRLFVQGKADP